MSKHLKLVKNADLGTSDNPEKNSDLINPEDFKTISLKISLLNSTTKTEIRDGKRIYGIDAVKINADKNQEDLSVVLTEFGERSITLEIPSHVCSSGHNLVITIVTEGASPNVTFAASGKVESTEKLPTGRERINVNLTQYDDRVWNSLLNTYSRRQEEILRFFKAVKD